MKIWEVYIDYFGDSEELGLFSTLDAAIEKVKEELKERGDDPNMEPEQHEGEPLEYDCGEYIIAIVERVVH